MMGFEKLWIPAAAAAALCAVGFYQYVYFLSVGYGLAVAGIGVALLAMFGGRGGVLGVVLCVLLIAYGLRLAGFLVYRESRSAGYRKTLKETAGADKKMSFPLRAAIWICVVVLYTAQTSPVFYRLYNGTRGGFLTGLGVLVSAAGLAIETAADVEKSRQKKLRPDMAATEGLYRFVRCPNYFGEILFWTGMLLGGLTALRGWGQWLLAAFGYAGIVYVMASGAKRLEKRQRERYGSKPEYQAYAEKTPVLFPGVKPRRSKKA